MTDGEKMLVWLADPSMPIPVAEMKTMPAGLREYKETHGVFPPLWPMDYLRKNGIPDVYDTQEKNPRE